MAFRTLFPSARTIIGVIHLPALPGYPGSPGLGFAIDKALADLAALEGGGADGILVENEYDRPHTVLASREAIACLTRITREVATAARRSVVGVEFLINDPEASIAIAAAAGARFIRTDYFTDPMERAEYGGAMRIDPEAVLGYRARIGAGGVAILADIQVKYARMTVDRTLDESARIAFAHGADAVIVSGDRTGEPPQAADIALAKAGAGANPVLIGSGLDAANAHDLLAPGDGAVVGTSLKEGPNITAERVRAVVDVARSFGP